MDNTCGTKPPESIYIVGFPKSGNTWLARLLADVLHSPVVSGAMRGSPEVASDINKELSLPSKDMLYAVKKVHFLPAFFLKEVDSAPQKIVYIYRDYRDVVISAFFYFVSKYKEADVRITSFFSVIFCGPQAIFSYYQGRRRLLNYVKSLSTKGIPELEDCVGIWSQHITEWRNIRTQLPDTDIVFISYEELLKDTTAGILRLIKELNLSGPSVEDIQAAVERQSFKTRKKKLQEMPENASLTFGKEFNVSFLRKGVSGDWKNFLSKRMGQTIHRYHGKMLLDLGYESDPDWYRKI